MRHFAGWGWGNAMRTAGLFLSHIRSPRIDRHFDRLVRECGYLVEWHFVYNEGRFPAPQVNFPIPSARDVFPRRFAEMECNEGTVGGYADTTLWPCMLALGADLTWLMEFDVDFSGHWETFFAQFAANEADLLTATLFPRAQSAGWWWWPKAKIPPSVGENEIYRAFLPLTRISRRLAVEYVRRMKEPDWFGHYEFTIPTVALSAGMAVEDLGGMGLCAPKRGATGITAPPRTTLICFLGRSPAAANATATFSKRRSVSTSRICSTTRSSPA
jgi:hypothetical protein